MTRPRADIPPAVRARSRGFTLLEVMVALMILATSLVVLLANHSFSIRLSKVARDLTMASMIARDKMAEVEIAGYPPVGDTDGDFEDRYPGFKWVLSVVDSQFPDVREIHLTIIWGGGSPSETLELVNYLAAYQYPETQGTVEGGGIGTTGKTPNTGTTPKTGSGGLGGTTGGGGSGGLNSGGGQ